jgi:manganese efflux pump family protein
MPLFEVILISISLAMDAFAVSIGAGMSGYMVNKRAKFRISFHFGLFQFLMPIIGWYGGIHIEPLIKNVDHWIALGLLSFVGIRMIRSGLSSESEAFSRDPSKGANLVILSIATSIDALAIGLSLAVLKVGIWYPSVMIGIITGGLSLIGISLGKRIGEKLGKQMEVLGGLILIGIGIKILIEHLSA